MSIFKDTFKKGVTDQIESRQVEINNRTSLGMQYYNSRNAWIRMTSAVDVGGDNGALAKKYILQGGLVDGTTGTLRSGLGNFSNAYSNVGGDGEPYRLGIRPMPGITGLGIEHKSSYGSLRNATVNFQCWDIKQLEDLELLYMRPGYSVMVEWGWSPYLTNDGNIESNIQFINDVLNGGVKKEEIWRKIYNKSIKDGNYDAMYGFVKNYSWKTRMDGGYDCSTVIVSMGEVLESLKVNYCPLNSDADRKGIWGKVPTPFEPNSFGAKAYQQNIVAGIFSELYATYFAAPLDAPASGSTTDTGTTTTTPTTPSTPPTPPVQPTVSQTTPTPTPPVTPIPQKAFVIGDSQTPLIKNNSTTLQPITAEGILWKVGWFLKNLSEAVKKYPKDETVTIVFINIGTNGGFSKGDAISDLITSIKTTFPNAKLYAIKGSWGWGGNDKITEPQVNDYYNIFSTKGVTVLKNAIGFYKTHPDSSTPSFKLIGQEIDGIVAGAGAVSGIASGVPAAQPLSAAQISQIISGLPPEAQAELLGNPVPGFTKGTPQTIKLDEETYDIFGLALDVSSLPKQMKDTIFDEGVQAYITLEGVIKILNKYVLISDVENKTPITEISLTEGDYSSTPGAPLLCLGNKFQLSTNPSVCLIKNKAWLNPTSLGFKDITFDGTVALKGIMESLDKDFWYEGDFNQKQLGIIKNIYVNIGYIYSLVTSEELENQDRREKNEIPIFDFLKNLLSGISTAIGNVANFDIFVDSQDGKARIIDVNYVDSTNQEKVWNDAHILEIGNNKSIVRSYSFESSMLPEQITMLATAAQVEGGGTLAENQNTIVDFNQKLVDRVIPKKKAPDNKTEPTDPKAALTEKIKNLKESTNVLIGYFDQLTPGTFEGRGDYDLEESSKYSNALRDIINFWIGLTPNPNKNRSIIPTKLSVDIDGIGGIIAGNIFRIPNDIMPRGYKGEDGVGPTKLAYTVTNVGHGINNNDWVTKIQAQMVILDPPQGINVDILNVAFDIVNALPEQTGSLIDKLNNLSAAGAAGYQNITTTSPTDASTTSTYTGNVPAVGYNPGGTTQTFNGKVYKNGQVDELLVPIRADLYNRHYSSVNQSDGKRIRLQANAMKDLERLLSDAYAAGIYIKVNSAYRTYEDQVRIKATATLPAATPGTSNHGFGKAVDLANQYGARINPNLTPAEWTWIQANKIKYNFQNINSSNESHHYNYYGG